MPEPVNVWRGKEEDLMKAALMKGYGERLAVEETEEPKLQGPHDVIVRVGGAGVCRTDLHLLEGVWKGRIEPELPHVPGHENAGWVEEVGPAVTSVRPGAAVLVHPVMSCGTCWGCRIGEEMYCTDPAGFAGLTAPGGFAEYVRTSERALVALPPNLHPADVAPYADAGITAYRAMRKAAAMLAPGDPAVVIGIGGLGHVGLQILRILASSAVLVALDTRQEALDLADGLGVADHLVLAGEDAAAQVRRLTADEGAAVVVDFVGEGSTPNLGLEMLRMGGSYIIVGYGGTIHTPTIDVMAQEWTIHGTTVGSHRDLWETVKLAAAGRIRLTSTRYPLEGVNDALKDLDQGGVVGRAVVVP
jgi:NAD+-dependent secondary alcohol dehydrogenase Adh1